MAKAVNKVVNRVASKAVNRAASKVVNRVASRAAKAASKAVKAANRAATAKPFYIQRAGAKNPQPSPLGSQFVGAVQRAMYALGLIATKAADGLPIRVGNKNV